MIDRNRWERAGAWLLHRIMPPARRGWAAAMESEACHLPANEWAWFMSGCLRAAIFERIMDMRIGLRIAFFATLFGTALLALLGAANAVRLFATEPAVALALAGTSLIWLAAFACALAGRADWVCRTAIGAFAFYLAAGAAGLAGLPAFSGSARFLTWLAVEGLILAAMLLAVASIPGVWSRPNAA